MFHVAFSRFVRRAIPTRYELTTPAHKVRRRQRTGARKAVAWRGDLVWRGSYAYLLRPSQCAAGLSPLRLRLWQESGYPRRDWPRFSRAPGLSALELSLRRRREPIRA